MRQGPSAYGPAGSISALSQDGLPAQSASVPGVPPAVPLSIASSPVRAQERAAKNHCTIMQLSGRDLHAGALTLET
ncbi:hypothetical protein Srufu_009920 [Streptomyces libani subsp. rufus]|nr:hypothetical protein Srufu_009920 [Streptomyces libani subsp. rufus]